MIVRTPVFVSRACPTPEVPCACTIRWFEKNVYLKPSDRSWLGAAQSRSAAQLCDVRCARSDGLCEELVEAVQLGADGQVDGLVADLHDSSAEDGGVDLARERDRERCR